MSRRRLLPLAPLLLLGGCYPSSQAFPVDRQTVWNVAVGEAVMWRPERIDEKTMVIVSVKSDLSGNELRYEAQVKTDPNPFAMRPSTRLYVTMGQVKPKNVRYVHLEQQYLAQVEQRLKDMRPPGK